MVQKPEEYRWSSYPEYIGRGKKKGWLTCDWIRGQYSRDEAKARRLYKAFIDEGLTLKENPFDALKGGLILGGKGFIDEIKKKIKLKIHREIPESRRLTCIRYENVIAAVAKGLNVGERKIREPGRRDNLSRKISLYLLRKSTDISNEEIAGHFGIGYTAVSQATSRLKKELEENRRLKEIVQDIEKELLLRRL